MHAAFEPVFERALAASARVDLRLDDKVVSTDLAGHRPGFLSGAGDLAGTRGNAVLLEKFLGLVFVDVHAREGEVTG